MGEAHLLLFFHSKRAMPFWSEGIRFALRLGWRCQPATLASRKVFFATYTPPQKMDWIFFAPLRRRELCETFYKLNRSKRAAPVCSCFLR